MLAATTLLGSGITNHVRANRRGRCYVWMFRSTILHMNRRDFLQSTAERCLLAGAFFSPVGARYLTAQEQQARRGMPPLKLTAIRTIQTRPNAGWSIVKVETSEPGLYGIGSARTCSGRAPFRLPLKPSLRGWSAGPRRDRGHLAVELHELAMAQQRHHEPGAQRRGHGALGHQGKASQYAAYQLLGGKSRVAVPVYDHAREEKTFEGCEEAVRRSMEAGFTHIRVQLGGYGGGGFIDPGKGERPAGGPKTRVFDEELYIDTIPKLFEHIRAKSGSSPSCCTMPRSI